MSIGEAFRKMVSEAACKVLTIKDLKALDDAEVEARVNTRGRENNPKWDNPITGYETFSEGQKAYLRGQARIELEDEAA